MRALCTLADAGERPVTAESLAQAPGPAGEIPREHPQRHASGRPAAQPAGGRGRLPAVPPGRRHHRGRGDPPARRPAGRGPRASGRRRPSYEGSAEHLQYVWVAVRASLRSVLEQVTIADIVAGDLPRSVREADHRPRRLAVALAARVPATARSIRLGRDPSYAAVHGFATRPPVPRHRIAIWPGPTEHAAADEWPRRTASCSPSSAWPSSWWCSTYPS